MTGSTNTPCGFYGWALAFGGDYYDDNYPAGRCDFLHVLFDGLYLEHPFIVLPTRRAIFELILWARKTVRRITQPGRSYRGGRRK